MNKQTYIRKDENYIHLGINAGGIIIVKALCNELLFRFGKNLTSGGI